MHPQPSPDAAALRHRSSPDLTYLPGSMPPQPSHAKPEHRVTASRAAHLLWTPCGAPQTMVPSREEVRGEGAQGVSEKEETGEFWAGQGLVRSGVCYDRPQLPRPPPHLRLVHAGIPGCRILSGCPNDGVRSGRSGGCLGPFCPRGQMACTNATIPCPGSGGPPTLPPTTSSAPYRAPPIPGQALSRRPPRVPALPDR